MHVFIAVPTDGSVHAWFAQSLASMVARTISQGVFQGGKKVIPQITTRFEIGKLPMVRNRLLKEGIASGADYMLWLDSDHVFPDWSLMRLLLAEREVVGINQPTRSRPHITTAKAADGSLLYGSEDEAKKGLIERVSQIGFAMVLVKMSIIPALAMKAAEEGRDGIYPMFAFTMTEDPDTAGGEDTFFCERLSEAGIEIHVDHQLSWATFHMAELPVGMRDAIAHRSAAEALTK